MNNMQIQPRKEVDFELNSESIPKFWYANDPFKTRLWDALSIIFPPGEKFFMTSMRNFKPQISQKLKAELDLFNSQEASHGIIHRKDNDRIAKNNTAVDFSRNLIDELMNKQYTSKYSKEYQIAITAALEHFTALGANAVFHPSLFNGADYRIFAMYAWHAIEEVEHRDVAYDIMQSVDVGYFKRILALLHSSVMFPLMIAKVQNILLKADGYTKIEIAKMRIKNIPWMVKSSFILLNGFFSYFSPFYHPNKHAPHKAYFAWKEEYEKKKDAISAASFVKKFMRS